MKKSLIALLVILTSSLILAGCTHNTSKNGTNDTNGITDVAVDFEVTAANLSFTPSQIEVQAGETVKIRVTSTDDMHDFVIDKLNVNSGLIAAGGSTVVEIIVPSDASGQEYEFYCSVSNHRALGMVGTLKVL